jgi:hypothetical protein
MPISIVGPCVMCGDRATTTRYGDPYGDRCAREEFQRDYHGARAALETVAGAIRAVLNGNPDADDLRGSR